MKNCLSRRSNLAWMGICLVLCMMLINPGAEAARKQRRSQGPSVKPDDKNHELSSEAPRSFSETPSETVEGSPGVTNEAPRLNPLPVNGAQVPVVPSLPPPVPSVEEVQKQIDDILRMNQVLKARYAGQAEEVRRISEQAQIHQRILSGLAIQKVPAAVPQTTSGLPRVPALPNIPPKLSEDQTLQNKNDLAGSRSEAQTGQAASQPTQ